MFYFEFSFPFRNLSHPRLYHNYPPHCNAQNLGDYACIGHQTQVRKIKSVHPDIAPDIEQFSLYKQG